MPHARRAALGRDRKLQRHPHLLRSIACPDVVFPAGRPEAAVRLAPEALAILDRFARPRRIGAALPAANAEVLAALEDWMRRELLVSTARARAAVASLPNELRLWAGSLPRLRKRLSKLGPVRRERLDGFELAVVDRAFAPSEVEAAFQAARESSYTRVIATDHVRDVYEIAGRVPFIDCITAVVERVFPRKKLELYWAYYNRIRYGDVAIAHRDTQTPSLTAIYHANADWQDEWEGETLFYGAGGEAVFAVAPRPGRLVLFDGQMLHRGGVPSRLCHEGKLSIVVRYWMRDAAP